MGRYIDLCLLRLAAGRVDDGPWIQAMASSAKLQENSKHSTGSTRTGFAAISDTTDTTSSRPQYLLSVGFTRGPFHASVGDRIRSVSGALAMLPKAALFSMRRTHSRASTEKKTIFAA